MIKKIDHLGIAVRSIEEASKIYERVLGLKCERTEDVSSQKVRISFYSVGDTHIELLEPSSDDSPIAKFIEQNGEGVHHIAYQVDDMAFSLKKAKGEGCRLINELPFQVAGVKKVAFLHPKSTNGVMIELCSS